MRKHVWFPILLVALCLLLPARADTALTAAERSQIRALLGTHDARGGLTLSANPTANAALDWLDAFLDDEAGGVSARIEDMLLLAEQGKRSDPTNGGLQSRALTMQRMDEAFDNAVVLPLKYFRQALEYNVNRLDYLLSVLDDPAISTGKRGRVSQECRELTADTRALVAQVSSSAAGALTTARTAAAKLDARDMQLNLDATLAMVIRRGKAIQSLEQPLLSASSAEATIDVVSDTQFAVVVLSKAGDTKERLAGASVRVTSLRDASKTRTLTTDADGMTIFTLADFLPNADKRVSVSVQVTMAGRRTVEIGEMTFKGTDCLYLYPAVDNGDPYLSMASFHGKDMNALDNTILYSPTSTTQFKLSVKPVSSSGGKVNVILGGAVIAQIPFAANATNAVEVSDVWCRKLKTDDRVNAKKITLQMELTDGRKFDYETMLSVRRATVDEPIHTSKSVSPFTPGAFNFKLPSSVAIPGAEAASISLGVPETPFALSVDLDGSVIFYGGNVKGDLFDWKSADARDREAFQKDFAKDSKRKTWDMANGAMQKQYINDEKPFLGNINVRISFFAGGVGRYDADTGVIDLPGMSLGASLALKIDLSKQFIVPTPVAPIPAFIGFDFGLSATVVATSNLGLTNPHKWENMHVSFNNELTASFEIRAGVTLGVGFAGIASLSVRGYGFFRPTLWFYIGESKSTKYQLAYGGAVELSAKFVIFELTVPLFTYNGTYPDAPSPFVTQSNGANVSLVTSAGLTALPGGGQSLNLTQTPLRASDGMPEGAKPDHEMLQIGSFTPSDYIPITVSDQGVTRTYLFFLGTSGSGAQTQSDVYYASMNDDLSLKLYGSLNADQSDRFVHDFDVWWDAQGKQLYVVAAHCQYSPEASPEQIPSRVTVSSYSFDGATFNLTSYGGLSPVDQPGDEFVIFKPCIRAAKGRALYLYFARKTTETATSVWGGQYDGSASVIPAMRYETLADTPVDLAINYNTVYFYSPGMISYFYFVLTAKEVTDADGQVRYDDYVLSVSSTTGSAPAFHSADLKDRRIVSILDTYDDAMINAVGCLFIEEEIDEDGNAVKSVNQANFTFQSRTLSVTDYGVRAAVDWFSHIKLDGADYLYWAQSVECEDGALKSGNSYEVYCCLYDKASDCFTAPFRFLELASAPTALSLLNWSQGAGAPVGLYARASAANGQARQVVTMDYQLTSTMDLLSAVSDYPCVGAGSDADFLFTVQNTGNTIIGAFDIVMTDGSGFTATLSVDATQPDLNFASIQSGGQTLYSGGRYSVYRVPGLYDEWNGEQMTQTIENLTTGETTLRKVAMRGVLPGATQVYRATLKIPESWSGAKKLTATLANFKIPSNNSLMFAVLPNADANAVHTVQTASFAAPANDALLQAAPRVAPGASAEIDLSPADLALDQEIVRVGEREYLRINLNNPAGATAANALPALRVTVDGRTTLTHLFANALGVDGEHMNYGYNVMIPLDAVIDGKAFDSLTTSVSGDVEEFDDFDNAETLPARRLKPVNPPVTGDDFPLAPRLAALAVSLALLAALFAARRKGRGRRA